MPQATYTHSFGAVSWAIVLLVIALIFLVVYLFTRKRGKPPHVDSKAGDEGED
ncbi:hypothetical protein L4X63_21485 [Geomonas sp. Red32]|uniref:hypothetical protein n=1 Tax=Geomonas sp. Red32 TaxID=2912856 RepID=UPI00202CB76B|nr:hypothetical protein [Geomonas sp. Red32]MCM0084159.1 hypothetical protein [Geomonas sp. Red32]